MHITKALKARSHAIRTAILHYNQAAEALSPPRPTLDPKTVLDYVFLAEFDLLRDTRQDVQARPWARPPERLATVTYFKIQCSMEEKCRVEIEAQRLLTAIHEEMQQYTNVIENLNCMDALLAYQIGQLQKEQGIVNNEHQWILAKLQRSEGYKGVLGIGVREGHLGGECNVISLGGKVMEGKVMGPKESGSDDEDNAAEVMDSTIEAFSYFE
jgi:hypothetical protein